MQLNNPHCYWLPKDAPDTLNRFICELPKEVDLQVGELMEITTSIEGTGNKKRITGVHAVVAFKLYSQEHQRFEYWVRQFSRTEKKKFAKHFFGPIKRLATYS